MAIQVTEHASEKTLSVRVSETLTREDYEHFVPQVEQLIKRVGKIKILFEMHGFHGWSAGALWEDIKFDIKHFADVERLAVVGEKKWEKWMATFCRPFTTASIKSFDVSEADQALAWLRDK